MNPRLRRAARALLLTGLALLGPALRAAPACPPEVRAPATPSTAPAPDRGLLWSYEKDGRRGWLFGTLHVARPDWSRPGPALSRAIAQADRLALEVDLTDPAVAAAWAAPQPPAPPLRPALAARLAAQRRAACVDEALAGQPPALQVAALLTLSARHEGLDPAWGLDLVLAQTFHGAGRPVLSLERASDQLDLLREDHDPAALETDLRGLENGQARATLRRLAEAWARAERQVLEDYPRWCRCADTPADRVRLQRLLQDRNAAMAARLQALHAEGAQPLVAVGALHLVGPQGLPALLQAAGFTVQAVVPAPRGAAAGAQSPHSK
jgi:uncharacterized protein YbaP (TraB family)